MKIKTLVLSMLVLGGCASWNPPKGTAICWSGGKEVIRAEIELDPDGLIYTRKNGEWGSFHNMGADCILQIHTLGGWENNIPKSVKIKPNPLWD